MKTMCKTMGWGGLWSQISTNPFNMRQKTYVRPYCLDWKHREFIYMPECSKVDFYRVPELPVTQQGTGAVWGALGCHPNLQPPHSSSLGFTQRKSKTNTAE